MTMRRKHSMLLALALVALSGCATRATAPQGIVEAAPDANSPIAAAQRLHWALEHGDADMIAGLLTTDFSFHAILNPPDGSWHAQSHDRAATLLALQAMLEGVPGKSSPAIASLEFDRALTAEDDTRPGRSPLVHKIIFAPATFRLEDSRDGARVVVGALAFLLARGDVAAIPPGQPAIPTQWWIETIYESAPIEVGLPGSLPARPARWGDLLALYLARAAGNSPVGDLLKPSR